jgi:hypothetical protein
VIIRQAAGMPARFCRAIETRGSEMRFLDVLKQPFQSRSDSGTIRLPKRHDNHACVLGIQKRDRVEEIAIRCEQYSSEPLGFLKDLGVSHPLFGSSAKINRLMS